MSRSAEKRPLPAPSLQYRLHAFPQLAVYPEGNELLLSLPAGTRVGDSRMKGLGILAMLPDPILQQVFEYLGPIALGRLLQCSKYLYCCVVLAEDIWKQHVVSLFNSNNQKFVIMFRNSWRETLVDALVRQRIPTGTKVAQATLVSDRKQDREKDLPVDAQSHLRVDGVFSDVLFRQLRITRSTLKRSWFQSQTLASRRFSSLDIEEFKADFLRPKKPLIISGIAASWPATTKWTREYLTEVSNNVKFEAGELSLTLESFFTYADRNADEWPAFVFDPAFGEKVPTLTHDYSVPPYFHEDLFALVPHRPKYRWILLGNARSGSKWHIDPNGTHAWNAVVSGRKRWIMSPPGHPPPGVYPSSDGAEVAQPISLVEWYHTFYTAARKNPKLVEGTCNAGDCVFVPANWWHAVINLDDDTFAVTQNCVTPEIGSEVLEFLRAKPEQVSGMSSCSDRNCLADELEEVLVRSGCQDSSLECDASLKPNMSSTHLRREEESRSCTAAQPTSFWQRFAAKRQRTQIDGRSGGTFAIRRFGDE